MNIDVSLMFSGQSIATEGNMRAVTITLHGADFAGEMMNMRAWLDQHMIKPEKFTYKQDQDIITISLDFLNDHHAEAFKHHFDGRELEADFSPRDDELKFRDRAIGELRTTQLPTIAQARWWRLLAEEIRTEADNFGSVSARTTMEQAAQCWEQLAEEVEHRLTRKITTGSRAFSENA
jgi:hypothetical protein